MLNRNGEDWAKLRTNFQQAITRNEISSFISSVDEMISEWIPKIGEPEMKKHVEVDFLTAIYSFCSDCELFKIDVFGIFS